MKTIFVYGTLRKDISGRMKEYKAQYTGKGFIKGLFYIVGSFAGLPCVVPGDGVVKGEIYEVKEKVFGELDKFEKDWGYISRKVTVYPSKRKAWVWFYVRQPILKSHHLFLSDGDYVAYYKRSRGG